MAANLQQRLDSFIGKATLLTERYATLRDEKRAADAKIAELQGVLKRYEEEMSQMRQQIESLRVVTPLSPRREDVERSRAFLSQLVRDIDKCIAELTE